LVCCRSLSLDPLSFPPRRSSDLIFYGGMYGGSTTSILLNTPGESSSVITAIEGNKMAKAGRAAQALATAAIGSFVAGTIGTLLRSEEHTTELQSLRQLVCRLLLE